MKKILLILCVLTFLNGCSKDVEFISAQEQLEKDIVLIDKYLADNNITALTDESELRYVITEQGEGANPDINSSVSVNYEGRLLSTGKTFDSGEDISFPLRNVITGWQIGIPLLREGGSGTLYIPSGYAYGRNGQNGIPGNAILIFDVDLLEVN